MHKVRTVQQRRSTCYVQACNAYAAISYEIGRMSINLHGKLTFPIARLAINTSRADEWVLQSIVQARKTRRANISKYVLQIIEGRMSIDETAVITCGESKGNTVHCET